MDIDQFLDRKFDSRRYNCGHFVAEVWQHFTGENIYNLFGEFTKVRNADRLRKRIEEPESPCLVLIQVPREIPHAGIYYQEKILHILETGVRFDPIDRFRSEELSFYK